MAKSKDKKWSYSRWSMYKKCPSQYHWHYILKKPRGSSRALERGLAIHAKAEEFVKGNITGFPDELKNFKKEFQTLKREFKKGNGFTEPDISLTKNFEASSKFKTDWFIGFADYAHFSDELTVIDYKTGKKYPDHQDQGHAYSMSLLHLNPEIEKINVEFWYLDNKDKDDNITHFEHYRNELDRMTRAWQKRIDRMYSDKKFEATPNKFCNWCMRNKKNGGDCDG